MSVLQGICRGGPLDGKVRAMPDKTRWSPPGTPPDGGFYVYRAAAGPRPAEWKWIEGKKS